MDKNMEKYLPIGSVVLLKNGKQRLMITGYASVDMTKKDKVYDYIGCMFPVGIISTEQSLLFDHEDIAKIFCIGYQDDEQKEFGEKLKSIMTEDNIKKMLENINKESK